MMEERLEIISQLYGELRAYRSKEFQSFIFTVPIVGSGFLPDFSENIYIKILLTLFALCMLHYLWKNHMRMLLIKKEIVNFQELVGVNELFEHLNPNKWIAKSHWNHLGTVLYSAVIVSEAVFIFI